MIETLVMEVNPDAPDSGILARAGEALRDGELVVFPTETVYGLAADVRRPDAVSRVFEVKGRPSTKPLPVQVASVMHVRGLVADISPVAERLMERFWPGPLTLVLQAAPGVPHEVTAGTGKLGLRIPDHPVALGLLRAAGTPLVAPSANPSGQPPPATAQDAMAYMNGLVQLILDAGPSRLEIASTVIDVTVSPWSVLREGAIGLSTLSEFLR